MDNQGVVDEKSQNLSKELLYSEKFQESPFFLKKKHCSTAPHIFKVRESSVLKNVQMFLPKMKAANNDLDEKLKVMPASAVDIENTEDTEGPLIEMDLALVPQDESSEESDEDSDAASSTNSSDNESQNIESSDIKLPIGHKRKDNSKIEVLDSDTIESDNT